MLCFFGDASSSYGKLYIHPLGDIDVTPVKSSRNYTVCTSCVAVCSESCCQTEGPTSCADLQCFQSGLKTGGPGVPGRRRRPAGGVVRRRRGRRRLDGASAGRTRRLRARLGQLQTRLRSTWRALRAVARQRARAPLDERASPTPAGRRDSLRRRLRPHRRRRLRGGRRGERLHTTTQTPWR